MDKRSVDWRGPMPALVTPFAKDGSVAARFAPTTTPDDPALRAAIEAELAK